MVTIKTDKIVKEIEENYLKGKHVVGDIEKNKPEKTILGDLMYPEYTVIRAIENAIYKYNETLVEEQKKEIDKLLKIAEKVRGSENESF